MNDRIRNIELNSYVVAILDGRSFGLDRPIGILGQVVSMTSDGSCLGIQIIRPGGKKNKLITLDSKKVRPALDPSKLI